MSVSEADARYLVSLALAKLADAIDEEREKVPVYTAGKGWKADAAIRDSATRATLAAISRALRKVAGEG